MTTQLNMTMDNAFSAGHDLKFYINNLWYFSLNFILKQNPYMEGIIKSINNNVCVLSNFNFQLWFIVFKLIK